MSLTGLSRRRRLVLALGLLGLLALAAAWRIDAGRRPQVTVRWTTASELNSAGFHLYRGEQADGPFARVTPQLIPAAPDPLLGGSYVFTDTDVLAGRTYFYQLEEVEAGGATSRQGTVEVTAERAAWPAWLWLGLLAAALALLAAGWREPGAAHG
ncbi:MAG TPA: hypothetical protein VGE07_14435 [Herpetosiphonaceae bacterium]